MEKLRLNTENVLSNMEGNDYGGAEPLPERITNSQSMILPQFEYEINEYLDTCKEVYSESQQRNIRFRCSNFMRFLQNRGLTVVSEIGYGDILAYHMDVPHRERTNRMLYESSIKPFLSHLADKGMCGCGLEWFLHYLQSDRIVMLDAAANSPDAITSSAQRPPVTLSAAEYRDLSVSLLSALKEEHLSGNIIAVCENAFKLHFIYLDMNDLAYSSARAFAWVDAATVAFKSSWPTARRAIRLFDDYARTGELVSGKVYRLKPSGFDLLPEWCRTPITGYVEQRKRAKMSQSTTDMDVASCVRFCSYLEKEGIVSFENVTATIVKDFNIRDNHQTAGGKGAYNSRIRKFLKYLVREGYVTNTSLYQALSGPAAHSEHIVITLNETEKEGLKSFNANAETALEQRDKACVLLGTEMGIRGCDIVNLKFGDIDWKDRSIRFHQTKTGKEVWLAMPVSVGNAIFHYLKNSRPRESQSDYIFLTTKAPYRKMSPICCSQALRRALPDRKVIGSGFHVTRKTFATERLRNNVNPDQIANAIGHATLDSIAPYLSLDDERMELCPLSVGDFGLWMNGGFGNV